MQGKAWQLSITHSAYTLRFLVGLHLIVLCVVWLTPLWWMWQSMTSLILLVSAVWHYRYYASAHSLIAIEHNSKGQWRLHHQDSNSNWLYLQSAYCAPFGVILYFKHKRFRTQAVFIAGDALEVDDLRTLRICVRDIRTYRQ